MIGYCTESFDQFDFPFPLQEISDFSDTQLKALLDEAITYKTPKDLAHKSETFKVRFIVETRSDLHKLYICFKNQAPLTQSCLVPMNCIVRLHLDSFRDTYRAACPQRAVVSVVLSAAILATSSLSVQSCTTKLLSESGQLLLVPFSVMITRQKV